MYKPKIEEIKSRRIEKNMSMYALSKKSGLPTNAILRIENKNIAHVQRLRAREIAKALGCKITDIFEEV